MANRTDRRPSPLNRFQQRLVFVYQAAALLAFLLVPFLAASWLRLPFPGAFIGPGGLVNPLRTAQASAWPLLESGAGAGSRLVEVDGYVVETTTDLRMALDRLQAGQNVPVGLLDAGAARVQASVRLQTFPLSSRSAFLFIPYVVGLIHLGAGLWIFGLRRGEPEGRAFALLSTSVAIACGLLFDALTTHTLSIFWTFALGIGGGALLELALVFPQQARLLRSYPSLGLIGYFIGVGLSIYAAAVLVSSSQPSAWPQALTFLAVFAVLALLFFLASIISRARRSSSPVTRSQARTLLAALLIAFGPLLAWSILSAVKALLGQAPAAYSPYLLLPLAVFPVMTGYTVLRQRLLRTDYLIRQGALYAALSILALVGYGLLATGLVLVFGPSFQVYDPVFIGALVFLAVLLLNPLRTRLQHLIDALFFKSQRAYEERSRRFSHELTNTVDLAAIVRTLRQQVNTALQPERLHIYIYDPLSDLYQATLGEDGRPTSDLRFTPASPLAQVLGRARVPLFFDPDQAPAELRGEATRLSLLAAMLFIPMPGGERLSGWMALGPRRSDETYREADLSFLDQVSTAAAVAVERAQVIYDLERRVREMNILSRIAQGVNITVAFDDILELIYTQTNQILPVEDFHITLHNKVNDYLYFAFCLENCDRINARENLPLPASTGLSREVIRSRRPLLTTDYVRACQEHAVSPTATDLHAWVGVPLNAGAETIGALSVGHRDAAITYTNGQMELLQSIADQAAGAIIKTRLLQETERRAHQLTILNDITRQLTGTLESEPLLEKILQSAVSILNCEAGTLFLVDAQTDELVFRVVISPVAANLVGQRLAPGTGLVGQAVETRQPVIANNVLQSTNWFARTDESTGFVTRAALAVPLQVKEQVIGVLEMINRKDGLPFAEDDINLLAAFAGQAAVAIENSRLYTLTDQELGARVEELSVMQRIDRELNASLDVTRAMRITLEWALRQSQADAGLIGMLEDHGMRLVAQQGYEEVEQTYKDAPMPLNQPAFKAAIETGQAQLSALDTTRPGLLPGASTQAVIPIRREANAIGLIMLESRAAEAQSGKELTFLTRLSDHAAIAIANAQLYHEVQRANDAKSEFVSFVAHELKNPMTSIKGYTELIAKGAVGPVTDMQANFLKTIHSNVERMSTLVSDLNDNSKIEAGRLRLDFKAIDLPEVVEEVMRSTRRQLDDKKQAAEVNLPEALPALWADRTRLMQIMVNLVSNANKYTPEGGRLTVGAAQSENQWDLQGAAQVVHIWVQDTGIGISLDDQAKIFQKFFRSEDQKARESPGTGLGLNITKSLVEMMGGRIWFESEYRQGTTFHFTVPVAEG